LLFAGRLGKLPDLYRKTIMKKLSITLFCLSLAAPLFADGTNQLTDEKSRVSYSIGMSIGHNFKRGGLDAETIDVDTVARAIKDVLNGGSELMTDAEVNDTMRKFQTDLRARVLSKNKAQGDAFLTTNKLVSGIKLLNVSLPTGQSGELQYLVITNGTGPVPKATDKVSVNYRGTLLDGTEFDSSYKRGRPGSFAVNGVIPGWSQALQKMPVGSKWKLFIPSELGYGERGTQGIAPNSTLIFDVELLGIEAAPPPPPPAAPLTSDIIKVPSKAELDKGAKIEVIKSEDLPKVQQQQQQLQTNK
jgi:FKBP-type peptidyl-prolyl cis-trans isomerase FklB